MENHGIGVFWVVATQIFFIFTPNFGGMIQFDDHIFQMGWFNHQLEKGGKPWIWGFLLNIFFPTSRSYTQTPPRKWCLDAPGCAPDSSGGGPTIYCTHLFVVGGWSSGAKKKLILISFVC